MEVDKHGPSVGPCQVQNTFSLHIQSILITETSENYKQQKAPTVLYLICSSSINYISFIIQATTEEREEEEEEEEDMERQKKLVKKTRVIKVGSEEVWDYYVTKASKQGCPVVVHFSASWCTPSRAMSPFFEELALEYKSILFLSVDVDEAKEVASKLEIKAMPTFVLKKDGATNYKLVGANPVELRRMIKGFIYG